MNAVHNSFGFTFCFGSLDVEFDYVAAGSCLGFCLLVVDVFFCFFSFRFSFGLYFTLAQGTGLFLYHWLVLYYSSFAIGWCCMVVIFFIYLILKYSYL